MEKKLEESEHEADRTETKLNLMESGNNTLFNKL